MKKLVNGIEVEMSPQESAIVQAEWDAASVVRTIKPPAITKEQLLIELAALTAKIQALT